MWSGRGDAVPSGMVPVLPWVQVAVLDPNGVARFLPRTDQRTSATRCPTPVQLWQERTLPETTTGRSHQTRDRLWHSSLEVTPVCPSQERTFQHLMQAHHYRGALPKIGNTLWYIATVGDQWLALLSFSAPALKCSARCHQHDHPRDDRGCGLEWPGLKHGRDVHSGVVSRSTSVLVL